MQPSSLRVARQQNQEYASQSYDQTPAQSYDQSHYSYYQQQYAYCQQSDYSAAYQSVPHQHHHETSALSLPEVSVCANVAAAIADTRGSQQVQQQQNAYYSGLNPAAEAAVSALSQLVQFAGTMQEAERGMGGVHTPGGLFPNIGRYRRGGGPFRPGGHKNFGHHHSNSTTSGFSFCGRGHGQGRGVLRRFLARGALSKSSNPESSSAEGANPANEKPDPSADATEKASQLLSQPSVSAIKLGKVELSQQPPKSARCELCRVDCTSLQVLEQHKNGKRHGKNLLRIQELRKVVKPMAEMRTEPKPIAESKTELCEHPEYAQDSEETEAATDVHTETVCNEEVMDIVQVPVNESSNPQEGKPRMGQFDIQRRGMKRKKGARGGGKQMSTFQGPRQPMEPPKPKVVIPLICNLCNVKCDTKEVFGRHLSGKKHIAKLKRFEGHQAIYGHEGVHALYPPNPIVHTLCGGSQGSYPPPGAYLQSRTQQAVATSSIADPHPMAQAETSIRYGGQNDVKMPSEIHP